MLDLSAENKALCFEDSTLKPLYIFIYYFQEESLGSHGGHWQYFTTIDDAIVLESAEITEGVLEGNDFELGSFVVPTIKVKWQNDGIRYKDMVAVPVQKIGTEYIAYFDGYISNEEVSNDGQTVSAEIVSFLGERLNIDVLGTVKAYNGGTFYEMVKNALGLTADIWIKGSETDELLKKFPNANRVITLDENTLPKTLTASELLKQSGEFLGAHIVLKEKRIVNIDDMTNYQPVVTPTIDFIRISNVDTVLQSQIKSLPSGYKRVEYIESTGTQYIDTNIFPDDTTKIQIKFAMSEYTGYVIVGYNAHNENDSFRLFNYNGNTYLDYGSGDGYNRLVGDDTYDGRINEGKIYDLEVGNRYVKDLVTGREKVNGSAVSFDEKTFSIGIFGGGKIIDGSSSGKVFYCKIYKSNTLVADLVPCIRETDNNVGMYDLVRNEFFANQGTDSFIAPYPIETYTLPYYINSYVDKTNSLSIDKISVFTKTGDQLNYTQWLKDKDYNTYKIKDNIFFEALSAQSWEQCEKAVQEVGVYLDTLNLYYSDLQCIYPLFIESGDYLIIKSKNQSLLPNEYLVLDNITLSDKNGTKFIDTYIHPNSDDIELNIEFALLGGSSSIFTADARELGYDTLGLYANGNSLTSFIGYYGGSTQLSTFKIPYVPLNQKINFNLKCGKQQYQYRGTFIGNGSYFGNNTINTDDVSLNLGNAKGNEVNYKLYHFAYSQNGVKMCDMYPCMRKSDGVVGVYDIVQNIFEPISGSTTPKYEYETADIVVPALSTTTRGIHSMRADILCKAVNSNNK